LLTFLSQKTDNFQVIKQFLRAFNKLELCAKQATALARATAGPSTPFGAKKRAKLRSG
jgi:hypothetical protein